jgi:hypothetical protein
MTISRPKDAYVRHLQALTSRWEVLLNAPIAPTAPNTKYYELYELSRNILRQLCADAEDFFNQLEEAPTPRNIERLIGKLRATQLDLSNGFLYFEYQVQDKMAIDLMQQAEGLLTENEPGDFAHIPAAVLAGAVLEHFLRTLCSRQSPPITLNLDNGNLKTLGTLVTDLERIGLYKAIEKKQLKVWVEIRNAAAHGQFNDFTREQVMQMIAGVKRFIEDHK